MRFITRKIENNLKKTLERKKSILLLGPRQTGKTTLIKNLPSSLYINLAKPEDRQLYEKDPARLTREVEALEDSFPLVIIDEIQKVLPLLDGVQDLIDSKRAQFILTGSSARKIRRSGEANLLPGRVVILYMDPLLLTEMEEIPPSLEDLLLYGALPQIVLEKSIENREQDLFSYVTAYLEEEIRAEALVRNMGAFGNFLKIAASESGSITNFHKLSQDVGVSTATLHEYYQILIDCLIAQRIEPISRSRSRKKLIKSPKFLIYDLGVRRIAAEEGRDIPDKYKGDLFEQWVGLELLRLLRTLPQKSRLYFWRDQTGVEVDWIIEKENKYIPIEVKWTHRPHPKDARHVDTFIREYANSTHGYVICRIVRPQKLSDKVTALPWNQLHQVLKTKP